MLTHFTEIGMGYHSGCVVRSTKPLHQAIPEALFRFPRPRSSSQLRAIGAPLSVAAPTRHHESASLLPQPVPSTRSPPRAQPLSSQSKPSYTSFCILHKSWHSGISHPFAWFRIFRSPTTCVHRPWRLYLLRPGLRPRSAELDDRRHLHNCACAELSRPDVDGLAAEPNTIPELTTALEEL
jgi:hypothetical protein